MGLQAHILEYGLAVHEKYVPQDMRPLHKKLVDQFHLMKSSLGIQVSVPAHTPSKSCLDSFPGIFITDYFDDPQFHIEMW